MSEHRLIVGISKAQIFAIWKTTKRERGDAL
jgi:hypothetical protein